MDGFSLKQSKANSKTKSSKGPVIGAFDQAESDGPVVRVVTELSSDRKEPEKEDLLIPVQPNRDWRHVAKTKGKPLFAPGGAHEAAVVEVDEKPQYGLNIVEKRANTNPTETAALKYEAAPVADLPDAPDLESYSRIPVEEFGAALLRGMGWKGKGNGNADTGVDTNTDTDTISDDSDVKKRPAFLGLGAKPLDNGSLESGSWGKGAKRPERSYIPLVKTDALTGEVIRDTPSDERSRYRSSSVRSRSRSPGRVPVGKWSRMDYKDGYKKEYKDDYNKDYNKDHNKDYNKDHNKDYRRNGGTNEYRNRDDNRDYKDSYKSDYRGGRDYQKPGQRDRYSDRKNRPGYSASKSSSMSSSSSKSRDIKDERFE